MAQVRLESEHQVALVESSKARVMFLSAPQNLADPRAISNGPDDPSVGSVIWFLI